MRTGAPIISSTSRGTSHPCWACRLVVLDARAWCAQAAAPAGSTFYYATLYLDPPVRAACHAVLALRGEVLRVLSTIEDGDAARRTLGWWARQAVEAPTHPVFLELAGIPPRAGTGDVPVASLVSAAVSLCDLPLDARRHAWLEAEPAPCAATWQWLARACGARVPGDWLTLGLAHGRIELLQQGRDTTGTWTSAAGVHRLRGLLAPALSAHDAADGDRNAIVFARTLMAIDRAVASRMIREPGRLSGEPVSIPPLHKLWHAWRARRLAARPRG